jgi:hypothetical protein
MCSVQQHEPRAMHISSSTAESHCVFINTLLSHERNKNRIENREPMNGAVRHAEVRVPARSIFDGGLLPHYLVAVDNVAVLADRLWVRVA